MYLKMTKRLFGFFILIAAVHAAVLFVAIPALSSRLAPSYSQNRMADGYDLLADNLAAGNGYRFYPDTARTLMREPGYPVFLAGLELAFGKSLVVVKIANMILAFLTAWFMVLIVREMTPKERTPGKLLLFGPPLLFLFYPGTLIAESRGGIEIAFALLLAAFIFTVYRAIKSNRWLDYVTCGAVLGLTVLFRSTPILFPLFLIAFLLYFEGRRVGRVVVCRNVSIIILAMLAVLSPWIVRNYSLTGKFIPTASVMGVSAQAGQYINQHLFDGTPWWLLDRQASRERDAVAAKLGYPFEDGAAGYYQTFYNTIDEISFSQYLTADVVQKYKESPLLLARCTGQNLINFWIAGKTWTATAMNAVLQLPYLAFAVIGAIYCFRNSQARAVSLLVLLIIYDMGVHAPILAQARYSISLMPFVSILCTFGIVVAYRKAMKMANTTSLSAVSATAGI
jgi:4-amino-4-deoxy-L-arabinose transferase-like glycosyltransferase